MGIFNLGNDNNNEQKRLIPSSRTSCPLACQAGFQDPETSSGRQGSRVFGL